MLPNSPFLPISLHDWCKKSSPRTPTNAQSTLKMGSSGIFERVFPGHGYQTGAWVFNLAHVVPLERSKPRLGFVFWCFRIRVPMKDQMEMNRNIDPGTAWPMKLPIIFKTHVLETDVESRAVKSVFISTDQCYYGFSCSYLAFMLTVRSRPAVPINLSMGSALNRCSAKKQSKKIFFPFDYGQIRNSPQGMLFVLFLYEVQCMQSFFAKN